MYEIYFPVTELRPLIKCFWFLRANITPPAQLEEIIFTDAHADIVINFGSPYLRRQASQYAGTHLMNLSNLDAQRRYPIHIIQQGQIHLIGIRFRPGGLAAFLPMPLASLEGLTINLCDIFGQPGNDLEYQLFEATGQHHVQLTLLNNFFRQILNVRPAHALVTHIASTIEQHQGQLPIKELSRTYDYSIRTLERLFQQVLGLSPKFYARIVRFRHTLSCLVQYPGLPWADILSTSGYYDQPHFIKEFVEFTGIRPETYRAWLHHRGMASAPNHVQFLQDKPEKMY